MSSNESLVLPLTVTSKQPLRGFSSLMMTSAAGNPAAMRASSFVALVLKAPQDLHASILTTTPPEAAFLGDATGALALAFLSIVFLGAIFFFVDVNCAQRTRVW